MSSLTPAQIAHIEQNRLLALARLTARKLGTSPPSSNSQPTSVNPGVVRNLFESPKFDSSTENTESFDFNKYKFTDTSPDKGTKRPFVDIGAVDDCDAASKHTKISQNHSENEPTPSPYISSTQSTPSTQQDPFPSPSKPLPIKSGSIFGTTKHTPGKNGNIATMIKSMATISPEKSMELEFQKRPRNYSPLLSEEQCHVMDLVLDGQSLFFTGSAGTGKSFLLREIVKELKKVKAHGTVFVTATTGIAACNIGGSTIHSYAGIGFGEDSKEYLAERISKKAQHRKRWVKTKVLVIDEISMLSGELFDKLEYIARVVRKNERPFGNIQVILCGDFFQLPPVTKRGGEVDFCFESRSWNRVITNSVELTKVFRQADEKFVRILNQIRHGVVTDEADAAFKATLNNNTAIASSDGHEIIATKLEPFRKEVSSENNRRLSELPGHTVRFSAFDTGQKDQLEILAKNCAAPAILELKVDAQVILLKNLAGSKELVNGSRGVVIGFQQTRDERRHEDKILPVVKFSTGELVVGMEEWTMEMGGKVVASRSQIPLALAWCLSIHKSQGQTIELVDMNLANVFESGQAYVALSRAVSLEGLRVLSFDRSKIRAHPKVLEFYKKLNPTFGTQSKTLTKNNNTNNNNMYNNNNNNNNNNVYNNNNTNINNNNNNMYNNNKNNDNNDIDLCNRDNLKRAPNDPENNTDIIYDDDLCELPLPTQHNSEQFQTPQKPTPQNIPPQNIPPRNIPPRITTPQNTSPQNIPPQNIVPQTNQPADFEDFDYCDVYEISPNNQPQNNIPQTPTTQKFNYDSDICEISPPNNAQRNSTQLNKIPQNNPTPNFQNFEYDEISDQEICNLPESPYKPPTTSKYFSNNNAPTINNTSNNFSNPNNLQSQNNSNLNNNNVNIADGFYDAVYDELLEEEEIATIDLTQ